MLSGSQPGAAKTAISMEIAGRKNIASRDDVTFNYTQMNCHAHQVTWVSVKSLGFICKAI